MKLKELKQRFEKKYMIRMIAGILIVALAGSSISVAEVAAAKTGEETAVASEATEAEEDDEKEEIKEKLTSALDKVSVEEKKIGKEETVYVISDSTGKQKEIIVSEHLKNPDGKDTLEDVSDLKDIENVKGDETFTQDGEKLFWKANGSDIYYQGTTTAQTPISQEITYYLDGKEIAPEELAGKSGEVTIHFAYTNHETTTVQVDGEETDIHVPFVAISGMILGEGFSNVRVENGKVIEDGSKAMVVGYALPGLKDSLKVKDTDLDEDAAIPDYFEVTANAEDFELGMTMTVVMNATNFVSASGIGDLDGIEDIFNTLTDATGQLKNGSLELAEGVDTLQSKLGEFSEGVNTLKDGVGEYTDGASKLADGISTLHSSTPSLTSGADTLNASAASIAAGVELLDQTLNTKFSEKEKRTLAKQVVDTVAKQEKAIRASAESSVGTQAENIKKQAVSAVEAQAAGIRKQAEAAVTGQADTIKAAAAAQVAGQADAIREMAVAGALAKFDEAGIASQAAAAFNTEQTVAAVAQGLKGANNDGQVYLLFVQYFASMQMGSVVSPDEGAVANVQAQAQQMADAAIHELASQIVANMAPSVGGAVAQGAKSGATQAAGEAAVAGAQAAAGDAAVAGAKAAAGEAAVTGAKAAAGDAAVAGAKAAAGTAAYEGAKSAAETAAVSAAEQTKQTIAANIEAVGNNGYSLVTGTKAMSEGTQSLVNAMPSLLNGVSQLYTGSQTLVSNNHKLNDGTRRLADGTTALADGVGKIDDGAYKLADGIVEFSEEGIEKMLDAFQGDLEPFADRLQAVIDAGNDYQSFTAVPEGVQGSVKFIYRTEAIKK